MEKTGAFIPKVFLAEDEYVVREGIKNNIDWKAKGYEFCGEASDGEQAYPLIQKLKPDIVITDIKMPFMDGLELSRLIKREFPSIEIVLLTGYGEFEYAKEAINIGVSDYLLKPINGDDLIKELDKVRDNLEEKYKEEKLKELYMKEMEEKNLNDRKEFFELLVGRNLQTGELLEKAMELEIDLPASLYCMVLFVAFTTDHSRKEHSNRIIEIDERLSDLNRDFPEVICFDRNIEGKAFLFKSDQREDLDRLIKGYMDSVVKIVSDYKNIRYFAGIGEVVERLSDVPLSFESASRAFAHRYLIDENRILSCNDLESGSVYDANRLGLEEIDVKRFDREKIREFLRTGEADETEFFVEEFFKELGRSIVESTVFRQYIIMDSYFCMVDFVISLNGEKKLIESVDVSPGVLQNVNEGMDYIIRNIKRSIGLREEISRNKHLDVVKEIISFIDREYANEELSLNTVADHVNFSPNYLSMIFSQQTGQPFIKYLTDYRMNKAKELLKCTSKKSSEISLLVGYKDAHYFSYLFKKTQGITPTQYREGR
ncbi:MAG: response regulator [Lachnospiraceae bacterium]|nr:response regulator [Lachnospiraceae bacterium]